MKSYKIAVDDDFVFVECEIMYIKDNGYLCCENFDADLEPYLVATFTSWSYFVEEYV